MVTRNNKYVERLLSDSPIVYIDTASLMETQGINKFLAEYKELFETMNVRIVVLPMVCLELARHLESEEVEKQKKAEKAMEFFVEYPDIFIVNNDNLSADDIDKAFADPEILEYLINNRGMHKQLLITNDKGLSSDAYGLNFLEYSKGKRISVCYVNDQGELNKCACVGVLRQSSDEKEKILEKVKVVYVKEQPKENDLSVVKNIIGICGAFMLGVGTHKYGKTLADALLKTISKKAA